MIFLSAKLAKVDVLAASTKWWEKFIPDLSMELIESVCHSVLDIYQSSKKPKQKLFNKRKGLNISKIINLIKIFSDATHTDGTPEKRLKSESVDQNMLKQLILQNVDAGKLSERKPSPMIYKYFLGNFKWYEHKHKLQKMQL